MSTSIPARFLTALACALGVMMVVSLLVPAGADASNPPAQAHVNPCPAFSVQDVLNDLNGDWDRDGVTNGVEFYNGLKPCVPDSSGFCASWPAYCTAYPYAGYGYGYGYGCGATGWSWYWINGDPNGDYDKDGVTNYVEAWNGANPCAPPCPYPTSADLALNPNGDWDNDGASNAVEVWRGTDPCKPPVVYVPYVTYVPVPAPQRLPHVNYSAPKPPPPTPRCPYGYPYYHPGTGLCYANPVNGNWW